MKQNDVNGWGCIGLVVAFVAIAVLSTVANGFALTKLWGWFILPAFEGAPPLSIATAMGIGLIVSFLTHQSKVDEQDKNKSWLERFGEAVGLAVIKPALYLAIGWIIYQIA